MVSMRNKKKYPSIIIKYSLFKSYMSLELYCISIYCWVNDTIAYSEQITHLSAVSTVALFARVCPLARSSNGTNFDFFFPEN